MHTPYSKVSSHSQFQPLKEVWIGGVYPDEFFTHLSDKEQDLFCYINELTRTDLKNLKNILLNLGVSVVEPEFTKIDDYLDEQERLLKPPITPCDFAVTLGDTLYISPQYESGVEPFQHAIDQYRNNQQKVKILDRGSDPMAWVEFASLVRTGRDICIDYDANNTQRLINNLLFAESLEDRYRIHLSTTGDHSDGVFCPIGVGHILSTHYQQSYQQSFPDWEVFFLRDSTKKNASKFNTGTGIGAKWWLPGVDYAHYNEHVLEVSEQWIGDPHETVFDVNNLVVDEQNIIVSELDDRTAKHLHNLGITPHVSDFKTKFYWDSGIHCCTSDIYRVGECEDYWPNRGENGVYRIEEWT